MKTKILYALFAGLVFSALGIVDIIGNDLVGIAVLIGGLAMIVMGIAGYLRG